MKILSSLFVLFFLAIAQIDAQDATMATASYRVYGNCGMCKSTIEKAANGVKGVNSAVWEVKTDTLTLSLIHI